MQVYKNNKISLGTAEEFGLRDAQDLRKCFQPQCQVVNGTLYPLRIPPYVFGLSAAP